MKLNGFFRAPAALGVHRMKYSVAVLLAAVAVVAAQDPYKGYFQYLNVKAPKEYEHGYNLGNEYHNRNHYQQNKDHRFRAKVMSIFLFAEYVQVHDCYWSLRLKIHPPFAPAIS